MDFDIQKYIDEDKDNRDTMVGIMKDQLDVISLQPDPYDQYPGYGYHLSNTTLARLKPWEIPKYTNYRTLLGEEALYNIDQMSSIAPEGLGYELGVYQGGVSKFLLDQGRKMVCFDTFDGIRGSGSGDHFPDGTYSAYDFNVFEYLDSAEMVDGDIRETLLGRENEIISFAHLDMDVYEPTAFSLDYIWNHLNYNGVIMLNDYGL